MDGLCDLCGRKRNDEIHEGEDDFGGHDYENENERQEFYHDIIREGFRFVD